METQIVVVGAGPVGLTLAIDLGRRDIACVLVKQKAEPQFLPKMKRVNARPMGIFRRLGLADGIRAAGMPEDRSMRARFSPRSKPGAPFDALVVPDSALRVIYECDLIFVQPTCMSLCAAIYSRRPPMISPPG